VLAAGSIVGGRYQIVRAIGRGGMGEVYEAMQVQLARRVALKTIRADLAAKPELLARFRREAESAAALGHPNLVQVTDFYSAPGEAPFLVMEILDGSTLKDVLEKEGRIEPQRAAFIGVQLLAGLAAAHRAGIVHRDVKPGNVFLQSTTAMRDLVKVLDFGVAKLALEAIPGAQAMTQAGEVLGTLSYMAPEQGISGAPIDARTDIFAVGATLFHALAGVRPFDVTEPGLGRTPLDRVAPWVNRDLAALVERALQKSPDARWSTADEMSAALQPFASVAGPAALARAQSNGTPPVAQNNNPGWNPAAIGRLEAPTGGSSFGGFPSTFGAPGDASTYATSSTSDTANASQIYSPRDDSLIHHGARAPAPHAPSAPVVPSPSAHAAAYAGPAVSGAAPIGAVPYAPPQAIGPMSPRPMTAYRPSYPPPHPSYPPSNASARPSNQSGGYNALNQSGSYAALPPGPLPAPYPMVPRKSAPPWWIILVAVLVLSAAIPSIMSFVAIRNATNPDTIATNVEREVLKQPKQPCPVGDSCSQSKEEHDLTYPLCTRRQFTPYKPGEMVLAGEDTRIALVQTDLGSRRYVIRFLTAQKETTVSDDEIIGRLCRR
jgi:serine/threonine-protein kinase